MSKYKTTKELPLESPIPIRFQKGVMENIDKIHSNRQEFIRDAVDKLISEQFAILKEVGLCLPLSK